MEKLLLRPAKAAEVLGLGRSKTYELLASGVLPSVRIGRSLRVPVEALRVWIKEQEAEQNAVPFQTRTTLRSDTSGAPKVAKQADRAAHPLRRRPG